MKVPACFRLLLICLIWPSWVSAQDEKELAPVSKTYTITNATVIQSPGKKIERGNVVFRNGIITAVGKDAAAPAGSIVIKGDSLYVYAGFIDGLSHAGVVKPKEDSPRERAKDPGNPTPERAGITPQNDVRNYLSPSDKSVEEIRSLGFTAAQVFPWGVYLPGSASIVLLGGHTAARMVMVPSSALYAELNTVQGAYPSTVIGGISKWHELYTQASQAKSYEVLYASNRSGLERPTTDKILQAFYPVIDKKIPVVFKSEKLLDIHRVIALQNDLGFSLTLANLKEGWSVTDKIKASGAKVFLSLELPEDKSEEKKDKKEGDKKEGDKKEGDKKDADKKEDEKKVEEKKPEAEKTPAKEKTVAEKEMEALAKRKTEFMALYTGQAAAFQKAGIPFGFSTLNAKSKDIIPNLRKIIAAGLTEDQALAALTTTPAQLLGIADRLGSIEVGKIANLVISDKPVFSEKAKVRYVFVEGDLYKLENKDKKEGDGKKDKGDKSDKKESGKVDIIGTWTFTSDTPGGKKENKVVFTKTGETYNGTASGDLIESTTSVKNVVVKDDHLSFSMVVVFEGENVDVDVSGTFDSTSFKGTSETAKFGSFGTTGAKNPGL